jgi:hypothetical protein
MVRLPDQHADRLFTDFYQNVFQVLTQPVPLAARDDGMIDPLQDRVVPLAYFPQGIFQQLIF